MRLRSLSLCLLLALAAISSPAARAQQKPLTRDEVQSLVRSGHDDESGAKLIELQGIDFLPGDEFLQDLKAAGAREAFLQLLRTTKPRAAASVNKPVTEVRVFTLLAARAPSHSLAMLVEERGIDFESGDGYLQQVRLLGGDDELINALKSAKVMKPATSDSGVEARQADVGEHVARGAELLRKGQYAGAEQQYRAALLLDPQDGDLYVGLARSLGGQEKWDDAAVAARQALGLDANNDLAHVDLGLALGHKGQWEDEIAEAREALRLNPNLAEAHANLGLALEHQGDVDGALAEHREALRLNPQSELAHYNLGLALGEKGDRDGEIAEYREALRLSPNLAAAHYSLGGALGEKGDRDAEIAEYREALRLNPKYEEAHVNLGLALGEKGDQDGEIAEYRAALRLNPNDDMAHNNLAVALEQKGDLRGALEQYQAAYALDPRNSNYKQDYERLRQKVNP
jgi:tetratricopeptide (TPR) repeat protein